MIPLILTTALTVRIIQSFSKADAGQKYTSTPSAANYYCGSFEHSKNGILQYFTINFSLKTWKGKNIPENPVTNFNQQTIFLYEPLYQTFDDSNNKTNDTKTSDIYVFNHDTTQHTLNLKKNISEENKRRIYNRNKKQDENNTEERLILTQEYILNKFADDLSSEIKMFGQELDKEGKNEFIYSFGKLPIQFKNPSFDSLKDLLTRGDIKKEQVPPLLENIKLALVRNYIIDSSSLDEKLVNIDKESQKNYEKKNYNILYNINWHKNAKTDFAPFKERINKELNKASFETYKDKYKNIIKNVTDVFFNEFSIFSTTELNDFHENSNIIIKETKQQDSKNGSLDETTKTIIERLNKENERINKKNMEILETYLIKIIRKKWEKIGKHIFDLYSMKNHNKVFQKHLYEFILNLSFDNIDTYNKPINGTNKVEKNIKITNNKLMSIRLYIAKINGLSILIPEGKIGDSDQYISPQTPLSCYFTGYSYDNNTLIKKEEIKYISIEIVNSDPILGYLKNYKFQTNSTYFKSVYSDKYLENRTQILNKKSPDNTYFVSNLLIVKDKVNSEKFKKPVEYYYGQMYDLNKPPEYTDFRKIFNKKLETFKLNNKNENTNKTEYTQRDIRYRGILFRHKDFIVQFVNMSFFIVHSNEEELIMGKRFKVEKNNKENNGEVKLTIDDISKAESNFSTLFEIDRKERNVESGRNTNRYRAKYR